AGLLELSMHSRDMDSLLELHGPGVAVRDDDSGGNRDALISAVVEPWTYRVKASQLGSQDGIFSLQAQISPVSLLGEHVAPADTRVGRLATGEAHRIRLQMTESGLYRIRLRFSEFDAVLRLDAQGLMMEDYVSAGGTYAMLELYL